MKILLVITNADCGGAQKHVISLIQGLRKTFSFVLVTGADGYLTQEVRKLDCPIVVLPELQRDINLIKDIQCFIQLRNLIKKESPDIVHLHSMKAGMLGRLAACFSTSKVLYTVHGWAFSEGNPKAKVWAGVIIEWLLKGMTDFYILVSKYDENLGVKNRILTKDNFQTVYNGIERANIKLENNRQKLVFSACRMASPKNIPRMLTSLSSLKPNSNAIIAGDGPLFGQMQALNLQLQNQGKVELIGEVHNVDDYLAKSRVFLLTSDYEALPIAIIEALRAGLPVVSTRVGGVAELVVQGENGFLVKPINSHQIAPLIEKILNDESLQQEMGAKSKERFLKHFTLDEMLDKTAQIYHHIDSI